MRRSTEPRELKARFNSICDETGQTIKKGEYIIYYPIGKNVYKTDTKQAQEFYEMMQDDFL